MKVLMLNLDDVLFSSIALRSHKEDSDNIDELCNSLETNGLLNIPTCTPSPDKEGTYFIKDGARRVTALKRMKKEGRIPKEMDNLDKVPFAVSEPQDELATLADMVAGNANVLKTANRDYIEAIYRIATETNVGMEKLAQQVGKSEAYIWKLFSTLKLNKELIEKAKEEGVPISNIITLAQLAGKVEDDTLADFYEKSKEETVAVFAVTVAEKLDEIKKEAKGEREERKFELTNKFIGKDECEMLLVQCQAAFEQDANPVNEARFNLMQEIFQVDEKTAALRESEWEAKEAEREEKKKMRKQQRETEKLEESKKRVEEAGYVVSKEDE